MKATGYLTVCLLSSLTIALPNSFAGTNPEVPSPQPKIQNEKNTNAFFPADVQWFEDGAASTIFQAEPEASESPNVGFYQERRVQENDFQMQHAAMNGEGKRPFDARNAKPEDIVREFGNPNEEAPLNPVENAPTPFKGLMAAIDSGNQDLAYQYARQYVRHLKNLQNRSKVVSDFTKLAMSQEAQAEQSQNQGETDPVLSESELENLDPRARALLTQAKQDELQTKEKTPPVDPKGEVDVLFFFRPEEPASGQMMKEVSALYAKYANDPSVHVTAFSLANLSPETIEVFQSLYQIDIPIRDGQGVANKLGVRISPTTLFLAKNSKKMFAIEDAQKPGVLETTLKQMKGELK